MKKEEAYQELREINQKLAAMNLRYSALEPTERSEILDRLQNRKKELKKIISPYSGMSYETPHSC